MTAAVDTPVVPESGAEILARIKPTKRREETYICPRPDLIERWETANEELQQLRASEMSSARLASGVGTKTKAKAKEVKAIEAEIEETQIRCVFENVSPAEDKALKQAHPPRKGNDVDQIVGYNRDAFVDQLVRVSLVSPVFDDESWELLMSTIAPGEMDELKRVAQLANGRVSGVPKSALAEAILRAKPVTTSRRPKAGE